MGIFGDLVSGLVGGGAKGLVDGVASAIDRFVETDDERRAAEILKRKMEMEPHRWQAEINKVEAGHRTLFVAGWRPAIGWTCAIGLFYSWIVQPMLGSVLVMLGKPVVLPGLQTGMIIGLVTSLLGLAGIRTVEKAKGLTG